jgi:phage-related protein
MKILIDQFVEQFIIKLDKATTAKVLRTIDLLEKLTFKLGMPHSKKIDSHLYELRVRGRQEIRIFYCFNQQKIVLFHAFIKKNNKIPLKELNLIHKKLDLILDKRLL